MMLELRNIRVIAGLAWRDALRSRLFVTLILLTLTGSIGLPLIVEGDGTIPGKVHILLYYSLSYAVSILAIAAIWCGCAAIPREIASRHIHLLLSKPVHPATIWCGHWLGISSMCVVLLGLSGAIVYATLLWTIRPGVASPADLELLEHEVLTGRRVIGPLDEDLERRTHEELAARRATGQLNDAISDGEALRTLRKHLQRRRSTVGPGQQTHWSFLVPGHAEQHENVSLRFQFSISRPRGQAVIGTWRLGSTPIEPAREYYPNLPQEIRVPAGVLTSPAEISFELEGNPDDPSILFDPDTGIELLIRESGFVPNYLRSLLVAACLLVALTAFGLAAGGLLSLPTATFATFAVLTACLLAHYIGTDYWATPESGNNAGSPLIRVFGHVTDSIVTLVNRLTRPAIQQPGMRPMADGELISWEQVAHAALNYVVIYGGAFALAGIWLFRRREIGTAS
tara:strand:+ start:939 stop:2303 length:1365 start_codon:yes stop_codon:yes gene_type:complete